MSRIFSTLTHLRTRRWVPDAIGVAVVVIVVLVGYFEVPFEGKTFNAAAHVVGVQGCGTPSGDCIKVSPEDPRVDPYASSWALDPWTQINHRVLSDDELPLWNPYQGLGMPLAGNMQSSVFDPMLLALHVHPTLLVQDLTFLFALILIGVGAYVAARTLRLSPLAATAAGSIYALSGWFFTYGNNHWFITYLYFPYIVACIEWTLRSKRRLPVVLLAVSMTCSIFAGMPEAMFMSFVAAGVYALARLFIGPRAQSHPIAALRLGGAGAAGVALGAPLLLLFAEYLPLSFNAHEGLGSQPPLTDPISLFLNWMMPRIIPVDSNYQGFTRNWVGAAAIVLSVVGLSSPRARRKYTVWPLVIVAGTVWLAIYGGSLVAWTRHIPLWSQALWPNFGTPIIALMLSLLAAVGVQAVYEHAVSRRGVATGLGVLAVVIVVCVVASEHDLAFTHDVFVRGGWPMAALVTVALVAVVVLVGGRRAAYVAVGLVVIELVLLAPRGFFAPREDPYPRRSWIDFAVEETATDHSRVFSTDGLLFPDTSGIYGLTDPRMVDALYPDRWFRYIRAFISRGILDRFYATGSSETAPNIVTNPMFDILGIRYVFYDKALGTAPPIWAGDQYQVVFEGDGVTVYENTHVGPRAFVVHDVHAVPDVDAALKFLKRGEPVRSEDGSVQLTNKDPRQTAVVEAAPSDLQKRQTCNEPIESDARIVSYSAAKVVIDVDTTCDGLLVLGDQYYPGWSATVDGHEERIFATDVALRGVFVRTGHSRVEFTYAPGSFGSGVIVSALAAAGLLLYLVIPIVVSLGRRMRRPESPPVE